jgi:hypothetical protein
VRKEGEREEGRETKVSDGKSIIRLIRRERRKKEIRTRRGKSRKKRRVQGMMIRMQ